MPAKSESQRRLIYGKFGKDFAERHHFDTKGKLPEKLKGGTGNVGLALFKAVQKQNRKSSRG